MQNVKKWSGNKSTKLADSERWSNQPLGINVLLCPAPNKLTIIDLQSLFSMGIVQMDTLSYGCCLTDISKAPFCELNRETLLPTIENTEMAWPCQSTNNRVETKNWNYCVFFPPFFTILSANRLIDLWKINNLHKQRLQYLEICM